MRFSRFARPALLALFGAFLLTTAQPAPASSSGSGPVIWGLGKGTVTAVDDTALTVTFLPNNSNTPLVLTAYATPQFTTNYWINGRHNQSIVSLQAAFAAAQAVGLTMTATVSYDSTTLNLWSIVARAN